MQMLGGSRASLLSRTCPRLGLDHIPGNKQGEHLSPPIAPPPRPGHWVAGVWGGERHSPICPHQRAQSEEPVVPTQRQQTPPCPGRALPGTPGTLPGPAPAPRACPACWDTSPHTDHTQTSAHPFPTILPPPTAATSSHTHTCTHIHVVTGRMRPHPPHAKAPRVPGHPKPRGHISRRQPPRPDRGTSVSLSTHMARDLPTASNLTEGPSALPLVTGN